MTKNNSFNFSNNPGLPKPSKLSEDKIKNLVQKQLKVDINKELRTNANKLPKDKGK